MNKRLHSGAVALACLGLVLMFVGWLGLRAPEGVIRAPGIHCGDPTCMEAHP